MAFSTLQYATDGRIATITLDRPDRLNAIDDRMPEEIAAAVSRAEEDDDIHVLVITGAGRAFCAGWDLKEYAEDGAARYSQEMPWDARLDFRLMSRNTGHRAEEAGFARAVGERDSGAPIAPDVSRRTPGSP